MKYITFVVPSYNAEKYLDRSIPSLVPGGDDVEIIIVNDGSKDNTLQIARKYEAQYPNCVKVIDKANGGHGSGINAALEVATGLYFKCVDADDWLDLDAYMQLLNLIKKHYAEGTVVDLYLTDFVYNRFDEGKTKLHDHSKAYPTNRLLHWKDMKYPRNMDFFMMHMFMYRLDILKQANLKLPEHTFYVDNLFVYEPLFFVKTMYYLPVGMYQYYVGHSGQSISFENMSKNYQHQYRVFTRMSHVYTYDQLRTLEKKHRRYMVFAVVIVEALTLFYYAISHKKSKPEYKAMMKSYKKDNRKLYNKVHFRTRYIWPTLLIPPIRIWATKIGYKVVKKMTGWY